MWYYWKKHFKIVSHWKEIFWKLYNSVGNKEYRIEEPLCVKVKIKACTYEEYQISTISAKKGFAGEYIQFKLENKCNNKSCTINVYPAFELKSDGKIINEPVIFEMLIKLLENDDIIINKKIVISDTVMV